MRAAPCASIEAPPIRLLVELELAERLEQPRGRRRRSRGRSRRRAAGLCAGVAHRPDSTAGARLDVEAHVVERQRLVFEPRAPRRRRASRSSSGSRSRCGPRQTVRRNSRGSRAADRPRLAASSAPRRSRRRAAAPRSPRARRSSTARSKPSKCGGEGSRRRRPRRSLARSSATLPCAAALGDERGRRAAAPRAGARRGASWSRIQWKTALEKTTSTGSLELELGQVGDQVARRRSPSALARLLDHRGGAVDGDHAALGQALDQHRGDPAAAAAGVEHASRRRAARAGRGPRSRPLLLGIGDPVVGLRRPSRGPASIAAHPQRRRHRAAVGRRRDGLEGVDRAGVLQRDADVVEAVQQPVLDVGLDLELEDAGGAVDGLVVDVDPRLAGLGDRPAVLLVEDHRQQPDLGAVDVEDVGEGRAR